MPAGSLFTLRRKTNREMIRDLRPARWRVFFVLALPILASACASTGATFGSGVGDRLLTRPPYYAGAPAASGDAVGDSQRTGHLPVAYQRGANQASFFDPTESEAMRELLDAMTLALDSLGLSMRLVEGGRVSAVTHAATLHPPDVQFNCYTDTGFHDDDCAVAGDTALGRGSATMRLAVTRASPEWTEWFGSTMDGLGTEQALVITLEVGQYFVRQRGLAGKKEVQLGTDHTVSLPWVTSLETPVSVLQLTGALVGRDGRAIRIGAEGMLARRTPIEISAIGGQQLVSDADVAALLTARRDDLTGRPLVWRTALETLARRLIGRG